MRQTTGHVRIHRKLQGHPIWTQLSPAVLKVFMYFVMQANWKPSSWYDGHTQISLPPGSFITSYGKVRLDTHLTTQQIRDAFAHLESLQIATYRRTHRYTIVTVSNYSRYQFSEDTENTLENNQRTQSVFFEKGSRTPVEEYKKGIRKKEAAAAVNGNGHSHVSEHWPLFAAAVRNNFQATDDTLIAEVVDLAKEIYPPVSDKQLADVIPEATREDQRSGALYRITVPEIIRSWRRRVEAQ